MTSSLGSVNLLELLREIFYSLDYRFIIKEYNSGTARWKRCIGQGMGKGHLTSMPSSWAPLSPNLQVFTNLEALQTPIWGGAVYGGLIT